jgi:hypothetical protein
LRAAGAGKQADLEARARAADTAPSIGRAHG